MSVRIVVDGVEGGGLPGNDPGFTLGLNVFETLRSYGHSPFRLPQHLARLRASAAFMDIPLPSAEQITQETLDLLGYDWQVRMTFTAGGHRVMEARPIQGTRVGAPVSVATLAWNPRAGLPGVVKHGNRALWELTARRRAVDELLLVDPDGRVLEASRSSVIAVVGGKILTPPVDGDILEGVTRRALLDAARAEGLPLIEAPVPRDSAFDELYLCSTLKELAPVTVLDGKAGPGAGPLGLALHAALRRLISRECGLSYLMGGVLTDSVTRS